MLIDKKSMPLVAMDFMNDTHEKDIDIINDLYSLILSYETDPTESGEEHINQKYEEWIVHTIDHFSAEEQKMLELNFPPYAMHKGEHTNALHTMDTVFRQWKSSKNISQLKNYLTQELPQWFTNHIQTMDTVTAMYFKTQDFKTMPFPAYDKN